METAVLVAALAVGFVAGLAAARGLGARRGVSRLTGGSMWLLVLFLVAVVGAEAGRSMGSWEAARVAAVSLLYAAAGAAASIAVAAVVVRAARRRRP